MGIITQKGIGGPGNKNYTANAIQKTTTATKSTKFSSSVVGSIDGLLKLQEDETEYTAKAQAATTTAAGYKKEVDAYGAAAKSSESDADIARVGGDIQAFQDYRKFLTTSHAQSAAIAGAGFKNSGSALYLAKSGLQQGLLTQQIDITNSQEKQIGYLETASANRAQAASAQVASDAATDLATQDTATADRSKTNASALSTSLKDYFATVDPTSVTPEDKLTMATLSTNPDEDLAKASSDLTSKFKSTGSVDSTTPPVRVGF